MFQIMIVERGAGQGHSLRCLVVGDEPLNGGGGDASGVAQAVAGADLARLAPTHEARRLGAIRPRLRRVKGNVLTFLRKAEGI